MSDTPENEPSMKHFSQFSKAQPQTTEPKPVQEEQSSSSEFNDSSDKDFNRKRLSDASSTDISLYEEFADGQTMGEGTESNKDDEGHYHPNGIRTDEKVRNDEGMENEGGFGDDEGVGNDEAIGNECEAQAFKVVDERPNRY